MWIRHLHRGERSHTPQEKQMNQNANRLWVTAEIFIEPFPSSASLPGRQHHRKSPYHWHPLLPPDKNPVPSQKHSKGSKRPAGWGVLWLLPEEGWTPSLGHTRRSLRNCSHRRMGISSCMMSWGNTIDLVQITASKKPPNPPGLSQLLAFLLSLQSTMRRWREVDAQ